MKSFKTFLCSLGLALSVLQQSPDAVGQSIQFSVKKNGSGTAKAKPQNNAPPAAERGPRPPNNGGEFALPLRADGAIFFPFPDVRWQELPPGEALVFQTLFPNTPPPLVNPLTTKFFPALYASVKNSTDTSIDSALPLLPGWTRMNEFEKQRNLETSRQTVRGYYQLTEGISRFYEVFNFQHSLPVYDFAHQCFNFPDLQRRAVFDVGYPQGFVLKVAESDAEQIRNTWGKPMRYLGPISEFIMVREGRLLRAKMGPCRLIEMVRIFWLSADSMYDPQHAVKDRIIRANYRIVKELPCVDADPQGGAAEIQSLLRSESPGSASSVPEPIPGAATVKPETLAPVPPVTAPDAVATTSSSEDLDKLAVRPGAADSLAAAQQQIQAAVREMTSKLKPEDGQTGPFANLSVEEREALMELMRDQAAALTALPSQSATSPSKPNATTSVSAVAPSAPAQEVSPEKKSPPNAAMSPQMAAAKESLRQRIQAVLDEIVVNVKGNQFSSHDSAGNTRNSPERRWLHQQIVTPASRLNAILEPTLRSRGKNPDIDKNKEKFGLWQRAEEESDYYAKEAGCPSVLSFWQMAKQNDPQITIKDADPAQLNCSAACKTYREEMAKRSPTFIVSWKQDPSYVNGIFIGMFTQVDGKWMAVPPVYYEAVQSGRF